MLAGTPGVELRCPPKLVEVTEAGVPLICAGAEGARKNNPARASTATVAEFSRFTYESYSSLETTAYPPDKTLYVVRAFGRGIGLYIFCQFERESK